VSKRALLLLLLAAFTPLDFAATRVNVEQVEQLLADSHNQADAKLAGKLSGLELIERASSARLARWQKDFPGSRTREALLALADASAFLDLPPSEVPNLAQPDSVQIKQIFVSAITYANQTIKKLPNFSARRTTTHFDDVRVEQRLRNQSTSNRIISAPAPPGAALTRNGEPSSYVVTYRDGAEVEDTGAGKNKKPDLRGTGLTTYGEFGPILSVVIADAIHGKVFWDHWEQGAAGALAVFSYTVPQETSHFTVNATGNMMQRPAYHGEIAIDPANGTILRVTMVSDYKPPFQASEAALLVEYGPVQIGNATYTCPVRGVALSKFPEVDTPPVPGGHAYQPLTMVNDVTFTEYHVFRAEIRIVP
jgi:hypothetical protein